jgi:hypothetical protein
MGNPNSRAAADFQPRLTFLTIRDQAVVLEGVGNFDLRGPELERNPGSVFVAGKDVAEVVAEIGKAASRTLYLYVLKSSRRELIGTCRCCLVH